MKKDLTKLLNDSDYKKLLEYYQDAEFEKCKELVDKLEIQYPDNQEIVRFKDDILLKLSFKNSKHSSNLKENQEKQKKFLKMVLFAGITTLVVLVIFLFVYFLIGVNNQAKQLEQDILLLTSLGHQAEMLLDAGKPQPAVDIIEQMKAINADYENLPELITQAEGLLEVEENYNHALILVQQDKKIEALQILKAIEEEYPNMWDVQHQIDLIETAFQINVYLDAGNQAFAAEDWDEVIIAYENAFELDPGIDSPLMNEQLIQGYLNKIIGLLEDKSTTIEDIHNAENYYRKALSMVSQSKAFTVERENLQKASSDLLQLKFSQVAKDAFKDNNQTSTSIAEAVSYLRKASNLDPENKALSTDLKHAEYYQMGFKNFLDMNWNQATTYLNLLVSSDPNYANGNAKILLYESYYESAKQYDSIGLYLDAINVLEQAEILAWTDSDNLMKLFQVQVYLAEILGKVDNFADAVSYYQYALRAVSADRKLAGFPEILKKLSDANIQAAYLNFDDAYLGYQEVVKDIGGIYSRSEIDIEDGSCLAFFAAVNQSTVDAVIKENNLPANMNVTFGRKLVVPVIEK